MSDFVCTRYVSCGWRGPEPATNPDGVWCPKCAFPAIKSAELSLALGHAFVDPRVLNGTHEIRTLLTIGPVVIRKRGSSWNALFRGSWSPMTHVDVADLTRSARVQPNCDDEDTRSTRPHVHHFVNDACACGERDD